MRLHVASPMPGGHLHMQRQEENRKGQWSQLGAISVPYGGWS